MPGRRLGRARRAARPPATPPRCWPRPAPSAWPPGSRVEITPALLGDGTLDGEAAVGDKVSAGEAVDLGLVDNAAPTIGDVRRTALRRARACRGADSRWSTGSASPSPRPASASSRSVGQLLHTVASPPVAYLLFVIGLALIVFELFTAGVGVAGLVGAGCLILGCYGLAALPTNLVGGGPAAVRHVRLRHRRADGRAPGVERHRHRVASAIGSVLLYDGLSLSWITLLVGIGGMALAMIGGMPAMVRTRFSTPTIGREWMVGEVGTAVGRIAPDGIVTVRDAPWRARTNRATPIDAGRAGARGVDRRARCSRSSRSTGPPRTTATGAERPDPIDGICGGSGARHARDAGGTRRAERTASDLGVFAIMSRCARDRLTLVSLKGPPVGSPPKGGCHVSAQRVDEAWQLKAACRGPQAEVFFPPSHFERKDEKLEREHRAKAICTTCPVRQPCLELRHPHPRAARHLGRPQRGRAQAAQLARTTSARSAGDRHAPPAPTPEVARLEHVVHEAVGHRRLAPQDVVAVDVGDDPLPGLARGLARARRPCGRASPPSPAPGSRCRWTGPGRRRGAGG